MYHIQTILHTKYEIIIHINDQDVHKISPIIIAILKSPHHIHFHLDINICKKKNIKIQRAQIIQFMIGICDRFIQKYDLNI
jgi:hypothetical protein